ncbi:MAG: DUF447 family protein [Candidatus Bathyarchaeota archaeon]|nr:DUF447 family protein [Candidatus Bathyarchaeota archaeon]
MTAKLIDLGFMQGAIYETIVSTANPDGSPNAAPMGVRMQDEQTLSLTLFNLSNTALNLKANHLGVINLTNNIELFYKTAFKETNPDGKLPSQWFIKTKSAAAPKLRDADATVDFSVIKMEPIGEKTTVLCRVEQVNASKSYPKVYCRAKALTLEAIIHATRVQAFANEPSKQAEAKKLKETITNYNDIVNRVAPNSVYTRIMADLMQKITLWRAKS